MKKECLDIGIIQAFMDGELAHDHAGRVSQHIATCDACAMMLADAEDESAIVFPALEREFYTLVPTQRLWNKINAGIETERESAPFWTKAWAFLSVSLLNPSLATAGGLILVIGLVSVVWLSRSPTVDIDNSVANSPQPRITSPVQNPLPATVKDTISDPIPSLARTVATPRNERMVTTNASFTEIRRPRAESQSPAAAVTTLPGEESYVKTIASLTKTVDTQKDTVLRPGERIAYERDMAVVDSAIKNMRAEVKRNPKNDSAKQVLYSSYQNKIDLLSSVSQKEELVASLK